MEDKNVTETTNVKEDKKYIYQLLSNSDDNVKPYSFFIPAYQRGYRWKEQQSIELLDDINDISEGNYCLQPLIVSSRDDGSYEVVDGQQRLTTIFILLKNMRKDERLYHFLPFELTYETREGSENFLKNIHCETYRNDNKYSNIDFFHMATVYQAIESWKRKKFSNDCDLKNFIKKITEHVYFLWYELPKSKTPIDVFININVGRIPLTNAELIKAILLNKENYSKEDDLETFKINRFEISTDWDRYEQGLRDDSFWYFLNQKELSGTRIDILFRYLAVEYYDGKSKHSLFDINLNAEIKKDKHNENLFPFRVFSAILDNSYCDKNKLVKQIWEDIDLIYSELSSWYSNLDNYHIIGYLIASSVTLKTIYELFKKYSRNEFYKHLVGLAREKTKLLKDVDINVNNTELCDILRDIKYGEVSPSDIRQLLLLFNLATIVNRGDKEYRFPFNLYKRKERIIGGKIVHCSWDVEHIHARADKSTQSDDTVDKVNSLQNLTLLDSSLNRSLGAKEFDDKRRLIIQYFLGGSFIPICSKNVFLKVYSEKILDNYCWTSDDGEDYIANIAKELIKFFEGEHNK
jgi:uncharacterized protein with ParB-like and HNH nuclease domain